MESLSLKKWGWLFFALVLLGNCTKNTSDIPGRIESDILNNPKSFFYLDVKNYPVHDKTLPIGIFDSGTGGLTVMDAIVNFDGFNNMDHSPAEQGDGTPDFSAERFIYLGDQANMPYGNYSREHNVALLKEHIIKDAQFMMGNKYYKNASSTQFSTDKEPVKAIVIACNTATAYGKSDIERFLKRAGIPLKVIGVIDAAVRAAFEYMDKPAEASIGVMATAGTVSSKGYVQAIRDLQGDAALPDIYQQAGIGLAAAIDGEPDYMVPGATKPQPGYKGPAFTHPDAPISRSILKRYGFQWDNHQMLYEGSRENPKNIQINSVSNYISYHLVSLLEKIRRASHPKPLQAIILGCTHYPFYLDIFREKLDALYNYREDGQYIYRPVMAEHVALIDPARNTARELYTYLRTQKLFNQSELSKSSFYISVPNVSNKEVECTKDGRFTYPYKYGRKAGRIQQYVKRIPFNRNTPDASVMQRLKDKIPVTASLIQNFIDAQAKK